MNNFSQKSDTGGILKSKNESYNSNNKIYALTQENLKKFNEIIKKKKKEKMSQKKEEAKTPNYFPEN